jgi:hypothetical protein
MEKFLNAYNRVAAEVKTLLAIYGLLQLLRYLAIMWLSPN